MKKAFLTLITLFTVLTCFSCATVKEIPDDRTSAQIIQLGQNAVSIGDYKSAVFCYQTVIERFGTDPAIYVEAKYELGHVYSKQKKYEQAYNIYTEILDIYDVNPYLPAAYKKLCQIGINNIPDNKLKELQNN